MIVVHSAAIVRQSKGRVTFLSANKKVTKEVAFGEELS